MNKFLERLVKERPVGTKVNTEMIVLIEKMLIDMGYFIQSLPFDCKVWNRGTSALTIDNQSFVVEPSPFSEPFTGSGKFNIVKTVEQLQDIDCTDTILLLAGEITRSPLQPKEYPFYYPDEHKEIISLLEKNFSIPSGNIAEQYLQQIIASKKASKSAGKIILGAHMDTKYNTPGALDNAAGAAVLLQAARTLNSSV